MPNPNLTPENIGKFQKLILNNPIGFVAAVFFIMFGFTYGINLIKNNDAEQYWKEMYEAERKKSDDLKNMLLQKAGIIDYQKDVINYQGEAIKEADSTLRNSTQMQIMQKLKIK